MNIDVPYAVSIWLLQVLIAVTWQAPGRVFR